MRWPAKFCLGSLVREVRVALKNGEFIFLMTSVILPSDEDDIFGKVPQSIIDEEGEHLWYHHEHSSDLVSQSKVCSNAMKQYVKSRPLPSTASIKRSKEINLDHLLVHPMFGKWFHCN